MAVGHVAAVAGIEQVVRSAAAATGVDFNFLLSTAKRESGYNPGAHAGTSSAAGLFQFVEQTWMSTLKRHGAAHGYARYAAFIEQGSDGRYSVPGGDSARQAVMDLRYDPHAASVMAGELASEHAAYLREPSGGDLYAAHFLGPSGSARLIEAVQRTPTTAAASLFPDAAASNRSIFYHAGRPVSVAELYAGLSKTGGSGGATGEIASDPGEGAFMQYAGAGRLERIREQEMLVNLILTDGPADAAVDPTDAISPAKSMFSSELLSLMSDAKTR